MTSVARICSEDECDNPAQKRSLCLECYEIGRWGKTPGKISDFSGTPDPDRLCIVPNCDSMNLRSSPLCQNHKNVASRYTMTLDDYIAHVTGECAICGSKKDLCVDHDHSCCPGLSGCGDCNRGTLCGACNRGLGFFRDSPRLLENAIKYINSPDV